MTYPLWDICPPFSLLLPNDRPGPFPPGAGASHSVQPLNTVHHHMFLVQRLEEP